MTSDHESSGRRGRAITLYLDHHLLAALEELSVAQERSVSWLVSRAMKEKLGLLDEDTHDKPA
jgi:predicted transcriptional regulator